MDRGWASSCLRYDEKFKRAYDYVNGLLDKKPSITVDFLKHLSALVMRNTGNSYTTALGSFDSSAGDLRLVNVSAGRGGKSYLNYQKVPQRLEAFCKWLNDERQKHLQMMLKFMLYPLKHIIVWYPFIRGWMAMGVPAVCS